MSRLTRLLTCGAAATAVAATALFSPDTALADSASDANTRFLTDAETKIQTIYDAVRKVLYYVGGLGLIVLAIFAFFGKFKWTHFFALAGGLFLIGIADQLIRWLSNNAMTG